MTIKKIEELKEILSEFKGVSLKEIENVKLMNRTDVKFIFRMDRFPAILEALKEDYYVLDIMNKRICDYQTLYFDTEKFDLYMRHHNGRLNRYKIRCRKYVESDLSFFEIKFKNNKSRTIKSRIKLDSINYSLNTSAKEFIKSVTNLRPENLKPVCWVNYSRITLVNKKLPERLTLDIGLTLKNENKEKKFDRIIIAELKQDSSSKKSPFFRLMNRFKIRRYSISKYCLGVTQLFPQVKQNLFKPKLLTLNKILYAIS